MASLSLAFMGFVLCLLALRPDTRVALMVMPGWFIWLAVAYQLTRSRRDTAPEIADKEKPAMGHGLRGFHQELE